MPIKTVASEDIRLRLRDVLDDVHAGAEVIIERYRKPSAVVVNYAQWQAWKEAQEAELISHALQVIADMQSGKAGTTSHEELLRLIAEKHTQENHTQENHTHVVN
jgi:PHD/YefM family antitoxin component YafN of YafNO toxin-antitoxin module